MNFWNKIDTLDRRWVYLLVAISVILPFILPVKLPVYITPETQQLYDAVESLPDSSIVMLTFDYYPSTIAETEPMSRVALHHLFRKNIRIVTVTTVPLGGPSMAEQVTREMAEQYGKVYGVDFVNLGYKANYVAVLKGMGSSIEAIYPTDNLSTPLSELPLMNEVKNYDDIDFIYVVADNGIVDYWISIVNALYGTPVGCGVTAVMAPKFYAFVSAGQMTGLLGGMKGAAEYELLLGQPARATTGMDAQSLMHLLIIGLVLMGNIGYFAGRRQKGKKA
ncbi:MAG: hypothetical protein JXA92_05455 [candidate division Zixibacteria bacterium]|nr:hypothetical protein [candidate division Zixibacteria bacterium]